ncbi:uncharacterized protein LOC120083913 [Benincasa hispida]|uniref:uncharacterized protein LOC120083913 n=1 Tax=Benincasa hispida TaxID=102211 RepID=UPI001902A600|nr:uncharacterized protein LOC120083913 [Benincasa hispida]
MVVSTIPVSNNGGMGTAEFLSFARQVVVGRWFSLFASFLVMTGAGSFFLFPHFSKDIKETLKCDQTTLNKIGFYKDLGSNVGIISALLGGILPSWCLLVLSSAVNFIGHFKIWEAVTGKVVRPTVEYFCFYFAVGGNSQTLANTVVLVTCVKNFPERRGVILGLLKGFLGLGGAVLTQVYYAIYGHDTKSLILLIAWLPSLISLIFAYAIREVTIVKHPNEFRVFTQFLSVSLILALFLTILIFLQREVRFDELTHVSVVTAIMGLLLLPLLIAIREELVQWNLNKITKLRKSLTLPQISISAPKLNNPSFQTDSFFQNIFNKPKRGEDYTVLQAILSIDMLILYMTMIIGIGSSFTAMDNFGQIGESQGYSNESLDSIISIVSIFNFCGRIFSGFASEILLEKFKFPRPLMLTFTLLISCIGHILVAFPFHHSLYIASIITGFALGSQIPLYYAMISEIFGLKHYSFLYNFGQLSCPIGTYVLNVLVAGKFYDQEAKTSAYSSQFKCEGELCYRNSFVILTGISLLGAAISLILVRRTSEFYRGDIYKKFREDMDSLKTDMKLYAIDCKISDNVVRRQGTTPMR